MVGLVLEAVDVADDERHWLWRLTDAGTLVAEHVVSLDAASAEAFADLYRYLRWNADPDRRGESEASIVERLGAWVGEQVLGEHICSAIAAAAPVSVRVRVPDFLLSAPLELAHVEGVPLAARGDVGLVYDVGGNSRPAVRRERLRMVAVFSLPTETGALGLRRERYELTRMVRALAARERRMVELEVLQYGVTRKGLAECLARGGGPDVLHLSGHGGGGLVLLETPEGRPDPVTTDELLQLLRPAKGRLQLVVLSACESAAAVTAETLRRLGLDEAAEQVQAAADAQPGGGPVQAGLARRVAQQLGCAVVAMRYPVVDDFAIAVAGGLYEGLYALGLGVDAALRRAIAGSVGGPAISMATPVLLGATAIGLSLAPAVGEPQLVEARLPGFPDEPVRFVGRAGAMARASRALAVGSGQSGVLFHGMAGAGKTSCAVELAYRHGFAHAVWWQAPLRDEEWPLALTRFAQAWEAGIAGFAMVDKLEPRETFERFLPRLRALLRDNGVLVVLDNLETLLTDAGQWRDPRWGQLIDTLTGHGGESRVVLTSRIRPAGLPESVQIEPVHALSRDEAILMARELPNLRRLLHADRAALHRILHLVQGHPKLLELADAAAADPDTLAAHLTAHDDDHTLAAFFRHGESTLDDVGFLNTLATWTRTAMTMLLPASQSLLQILAGMEDTDRLAAVLEGSWADLCQLLDIDASDPADVLAPLTAAGLVESDGNRIGLHPGIAETVRDDTPAHVRKAVDGVLGTFWAAVADQALEREGGEHTPGIVRAGFAAAPYLLRLQEWELAIILIEKAMNRDHTIASAQLAVAYLQRIADATGAPDYLATLAIAKLRVEPAAGEQLLHTVLRHATNASDHRLAGYVLHELIALYMESGRLHQALALADRKAQHTRQAGVGPWTKLADQVQRLKILFLQGQNEGVLAEVHRLVDRMSHLPDPPADNEPAVVWSVREAILNLGAHAARNLARWQEALHFNTANLASKLARGASPHTMAAERFYDSYSLLRLGRTEQAEQLLLACQQIFEEHHDIPRLAKTLSARADVAAQRGLHRDAIGLERTALRLKYVRPDPDAVGVSHHNLADYLARFDTEPASRLAHRLAAITVAVLSGLSGRAEQWLRGLAHDMRELPDVNPPATIASLAAIVERVDGVKFTELVTALAGDLDTAQQALETALQAARENS